MLTGRAKQDFEAWYLKHIRQRDDIGDRYFDHSLLKYFWNAGNTIVQAFIVEWFDSVDIHVNIEYHARVWYAYLVAKNGIGGYLIDNNSFSDRQSATKAAIKQANKIYNER